ncbi:hypothetical protein TSAR_004312 [Trichomalopsis sarcophagae]|uniref:Uncharacterized protein n=1 Tax=Trichomalopsis sarcophagae TaxID=543379 RepID=A0A232F7M4_9HYME|nr:hypothetical protein TSAR_004312 [Trichomalopsis sarcophagae]
MVSSWTLADLTIFKEKVNARLRDWIQNLSSIEVNEVLIHLELHTNAFPEDLRNDVLTVIEAEEALEYSLQENVQLPSSSPHDSHKEQDISLTMTINLRPQRHMETDPVNFETLQVPTLLNTIATNKVAPSHFSTTVQETIYAAASTSAHYSRAIGAQATIAPTTPQNTANSSQNMDIKNLIRTVLPNGDVQFISFVIATELQRAWISERELQRNQVKINNYILDQAEKVNSLSSKIVGLEAVTKDLQLQSVRNNTSKRTRPIFHSTAKAYCPSAPTAAHAPLPRSSCMSASQNHNVLMPAATASSQPACSSWERGVWPQATNNTLSQSNPRATYHATEAAVPKRRDRPRGSKKKMPLLTATIMLPVKKPATIIEVPAKLLQQIKKLVAQMILAQTNEISPTLGELHPWPELIRS